ncbi:MAG: DNA primase DnaG [Halobacteriales archaeon]|nr:DNA primase DnaG [Halobacteriales archaeon]
MDDSTKYLIHADITADGIVERSDVVGAIFGQTEGLLGEELDLRDLQDTSKVGRIDVEIESEGGQSFGTITIASNLDRVETAILAAALETIARVGPCTAAIEIDRIEDVRAAKRRAIVERAKELLATAFDEKLMDSDRLIEEVRESIRVERITDYEGLPAGPRVADSDAVIIVEGRSDVLTLLQYGIKNAIAVEGTNIPEPITDLLKTRTVTAFLDGDRGGELVLRELAQLGTVDYVTFAPADRSVEDLERHEVMAALRDKHPFDPAQLTPTDTTSTEGDADAEPASEPTTMTDGSAQAMSAADGEDEPGIEPDEDSRATPADNAEPTDEPADTESGSTTEPSEDQTSQRTPGTLPGHVEAVIEDGTGTIRLLDAEFDVLTEAPASEAFETIADADPIPDHVVLDGELTQRVLDIAAQRGVAGIVARETGEFTKQPVGVRVRVGSDFEAVDA